MENLEVVEEGGTWQVRHAKTKLKLVEVASEATAETLMAQMSAMFALYWWKHAVFPGIFTDTPDGWEALKEWAEHAVTKL